MADSIAALAELRPLLPTLGPHARAALGETISRLEEELRKDLADLQHLALLARADAVSSVIGRQVAAIEAALNVSSNPGPAAASMRKTEPEKVAASHPPQPAPSVPSVPAPAPQTAATRNARTASTKPPPMDSPPGGFEPSSWPLAVEPELPADFYRSSHKPMLAVPRCPEGSKAALLLLEQRKPVILTHSTLVSAAVGKWDPAYVATNFGSLPCTVYASASRRFRYYDDEKNEAGYTASEFRERMGKSPGGAGEAGATGSEAAARRFYYLQTVLVDGVGKAMTDDFRQFGWEPMLETQQRLGWGELSSNLLLVGQQGNVTPAHYDEQQNLFAQLHGTKRVILFEPADFGSLYPFPVHHPCDRQSQVDLDAPDLARFPRFVDAQPLEARLAPGDVLYIPQYWWHHVENTSDGCVSLNFWFKDQKRSEKVTLPLSGAQQLAMRRNVEKLVASKLGAREAQKALPLLASAQLPAALQPLRDEVSALLQHVMPEEQVQPWLAELVDGRFDLEHGLV